MKDLRVSAAAAEIEADDSMVIGRGILPRYASEQEGELRASAVILEGEEKLCLVSCDVLMLQRDILDEVCREIERIHGTPFNNTLICATRTHHAPTTVTLHGYEREELFCSRLRDAILLAVDRAAEKSVKAGMYFSYKNRWSGWLGTCYGQESPMRAYPLRVAAVSGTSGFQGQPGLQARGTK